MVTLVHDNISSERSCGEIICGCDCLTESLFSAQMATELPEGTRDCLNIVLQLGYPFGLRQTNHNLWKRDERQNQQDIKPILGRQGKAESKETGWKAMFESQEQVQEWCSNFPVDVPLSALMEERQYLIDNGLLEREKDRTKASGERECESQSESQCDIDNINDGEDESDDGTATTGMRPSRACLFEVCNTVVWRSLHILHR